MKKQTTKVSTSSEGFSDEEKKAMKERVFELRSGKSEGENVVLEKINQMSEPDKTIAKQLHTIVKSTVPNILPKLWYGMPAYAKDGKLICFFQPADKFKARYATLGFSDKANLDDGDMWPTSFAVKKLTSKEEGKIITLIKKSVG